MDSSNEWIKIGNTSFRVAYLQSVTEEIAVTLLTTDHVHADRVRNAWKQANNFKSPNRKRTAKKKK